MTRLLALLLILSPSLAQATTYSCTNGAYVMSGDVTLASSDIVNLVGSASARCVWIGNSHRFIVADASWTGSFTMQFVDAFDVGTATLDLLGGTNPGDYAYLNNGAFLMEDSTINRSGGINLFSAGSTTVSLKRNTFAADNLISVDYAVTNARHFMKEQGSATAVKYFQSNKLYRSWVDLGSPNWIIGAASGCTSTCDSDGNIMIGKRVGVYARGSDSYLSYNYGRGNLQVTPQEPTWTQVAFIGELGDGGLMEHNVIREAEWLIQVIGTSAGATVLNNVVLQLEPHQLFRISVNGSIQGNITGWRYPAINSFLSGTRPASGDSVSLLTATGNSWVFRNNTMDLRGAATKGIMWVAPSTFVTSYRNNVAYQLSLLANSCNSGVDCGSAISRDQIGEMVGYSNGSPAARMGYSDYNDVFFEASSPRMVPYDLTVSGLSICDDNMGQHDLWATSCAPTGTSQGVDPEFRGPLPVGSGFDGGATTTDSGWPFPDQDIISGRYPVSTLLAYFQSVYTPDVSSPLLNAQDPGDGAGNMGAVQSVVSAPTVATTNKRPVVFAGPSFAVDSASGAIACDSGTLPKTVCLAGTTADDALPSGTLTQLWSLVQGPSGATVTFVDRTLANTKAALSATGTYVLRLTATDGALIAHSDVRITVE